MKIHLTRKIAAGMIVVLLMLSCFYAGSGTERKLQELSNQEVEQIALVNLDEGVDSILQDGKIYYSNELLAYNSIEFEIVSLESARNGVVEGRYAAYVILPADFSENIESINTNPQKALIAYAFNPYLTNQAREKTINRIERFEEDISYDITYIYVSAVLRDFHDVQDSSLIVLRNDQKDKEELSAVEADSLIELLTYPELIRTEKEIEELDFTESFKENRLATEAMKEDIEENMQQAQLAYQEIQAQSFVINDATEQLMLQIDSYQPGIDDQGEVIYQEGLESLSENFVRFNEKQGDNGEKIREQAKEEAIRFSVLVLEAELYDLQDELSDYAKKYSNKVLETVYSQLDRMSVSENGIKSGDELKAIVKSMALPEPDPFPVSDITRNVNASTVRRLIPNWEFSPEFEKRVDAATSISMNDVTQIIDEEILEVLYTQQEESLLEIQQKQELLQEQIDLYNQQMQEYDLYDYIEQDKVDEKLAILGENMELVETKQREHDLDYWELITEVYEVTEENQGAFDENLKESQELTRENVENTIAVLKDHKEANSAENQELLEEFTKKLAYTRLGSLGNIEAYDFIVAPVNFEEYQVGGTALELKEHYRQYILLAIALLIAGTMLLLRHITLSKEDNLS